MGTIRRVNVDTGAVTSPVGGPLDGTISDGYGTDARFAMVRGIAVDNDDGVVYLSDIGDGGGTIRAVDTTTLVVTTVTSSGGDPAWTGEMPFSTMHCAYCPDIAFGNNKLYVNDYGMKVIKEMDMETSTAVVLTDELTPGGGIFSSGLAFDSTDGSLYSGNNGDATIRKIAIEYPAPSSTPTETPDESDTESSSYGSSSDTESSSYGSSYGDDSVIDAAFVKPAAAALLFALAGVMIA
jgi:DNA-binding beta-propeller fold protein YncE